MSVPIKPPEFGQVNDSIQTGPPGRASYVLAWLNGLVATAGSTRQWDRVLRELVGAFGVAGAGVGVPNDGKVPERVRADNSRVGEIPLPWVLATNLAAELHGKPASAVRINGAGQSFLVTALAGTNSLIWLEGNEGIDWDGEEEALLLASRLLGQKTKTPGPDQALIQQRLQDAGALSGKVAHAFDNILTGIMGFAELTLSQSDPSSPVHQYIAEVVQAAHLGVQVTQQLHMLSRCAIVTPGPGDLEMVVAEEEARLQGVLDTGTTLQIDLAPKLPLLAIDSDPLKVIVSQLLDNACEAAGPGAKISLTARLSQLEEKALGALLGSAVAGPYVEIAIQDSGPGFTDEARRRVPSEPFFTTKPKHRGLGLAVVYRILAAHRAGFRIESVSGQPTVVRVFLPPAVPSAKKTPSARSPLVR